MLNRAISGRMRGQVEKNTGTWRYAKTSLKNKAMKEEGELPVNHNEMEKIMRNGIQQSPM
jgi:hypothetical protein